jgi:hypothetical protein
MGLKADCWIRKMALEHDMITPFVEDQVREGVISYGVSSYGYDIRVSDEFKIFTNVYSTVVDPKRLGLGALDLIDAIKDAGGNVTAEGQYPANRAIRSAVLAAMGWGTDAPGEHPPHLDDVLDRHRSEMRDTETAIRFRAAMDERDRRVAILAELEAGDLTVEEAAARYGTDADGIEEARRLHAAGQPIMDLAAYGVERIPASEVYAGDREDADAD